MWKRDCLTYCHHYEEKSWEEKEEGSNTFFSSLSVDLHSYCC